MSTSFVEQMEEVIEEVSLWAVDIIEEAIATLTNGDSLFDSVELTTAEQVEEYVTHMRGDPQKWYNWIEQTAQKMIQQLISANIPEDKIAEIHPYDIAVNMAIKHSHDMEVALAGNK